MSNFTPLKFEKGKGIKSVGKNVFNKKFFLIGNLILVVLIAIIGGVYYYNNLISTKQRAASCPTNDLCWPPGKKTCQKDKNGKNTGYLCECIDLSNNSCPKTGVWRCNTWDKGQCPTDNFEGEIRTNCEVINNCVRKKDGTSFTGFHYFCPNMTSSSGDSGKGCQQNPTFFNNVTQYCFKYNCGTEQIDSTDQNCFGSRVGSNPCNNAPPPSNVPSTTIPTPTQTPTPTPTSTQTPTPTPTTIITNTPTPTLTPTPTSSPTPTIPPNQPTNTPTPTNPNAPTPTPTEIIVVRATNTPGPSSTSTPVQQIAQTGDIRSLWIFAVPIAIILLGLLL